MVVLGTFAVCQMHPCVNPALSGTPHSCCPTTHRTCFSLSCPLAFEEPEAKAGTGCWPSLSTVQWARPAWGDGQNPAGPFRANHCQSFSAVSLAVLISLGWWSEVPRTQEASNNRNRSSCSSGSWKSKAKVPLSSETCRRILAWLMVCCSMKVIKIPILHSWNFLQTLFQKPD